MFIGFSSAAGRSTILTEPAAMFVTSLSWDFRLKFLLNLTVGYFEMESFRFGDLDPWK